MNKPTDYHLIAHCLTDGEMWGPGVVKTVSKTWGYEEHLINTPLYCMKRLFIRRGNKTSKHFHMSKHETLYVESGTLTVHIYNKYSINNVFIIEKKDFFVVKPGLVHSLEAYDSDVWLVEGSTYSEDKDSIRLRD